MPLNGKRRVDCMQVSRQGAAESSERYKNFSQVTEVEETELVDAAYYSTLCSTCRVVCHDNCQPNESVASGIAAPHSQIHARHTSTTQHLDSK